MRRQIFLSLLLINSTLITNAQTWSGDTPGDIYYEAGNISVGSNNFLGRLTISNGHLVIDHPQNSYYSSPSGFTLLENAIIFKHNNLDKNAEIRGAISPGKHTTGIAFRTKSAWNLPLETRFYIHPDGNVGVGTNAPDAKLHVSGNLVLDNNENPRMYTGTGSSELNRYLFLLNSPNQSTASGLKAGGVLVSDSYTYANPSKNDLIVKGNVLIGKSSQTNNSYKLDVNGTIRASEIKVNLDGADFVFEGGYRLMPLNELERFVKEQKHLPEIAPAKEMREKGTDLGNLNSKLLQKIEELTLYIIEQDKKIIELEKQNAKIELQNQDLQMLKEEIEKLKAASK
jgi:hypothetical protein